MARKAILPSEEEDRKITRAAEADPDNPPLDDETLGRLAHARRGRPALPEAQKRKRVNVMLDADVAAALRAAGGNASARINRLLRDDLGL
ncbi:BrnA antitoxin family protein [Rhodobacteraceae bacterium DSL-40]|uniref:BrnA antitoxin family protein n=1 Tax=Amaricoccus sp. B4 TaxID=3368557 RepID=UPI0013A6FC5D